MALLTTAAAGAGIAGTAGKLGGAIDTVGGAIGSVGDVLGIGGGGGPDPSGTKTAGSPPIRAVIKEDRTDQSGSDPATLRVGEGTHNLNQVGFAGFARAVSRVDSGYELTVQDNQGNTATYRGPVSGKKNFRDRGLNDQGVVAVRVRPTGSGRQSSGGTRDSTRTRNSQPGGASGGGGNTQTLFLLVAAGIVGFLLSQ